jgi:hypothetical protein
MKCTFFHVKITELISARLRVLPACLDLLAISPSRACMRDHVHRFERNSSYRRRETVPTVSALTCTHHVSFSHIPKLTMPDMFFQLIFRAKRNF